jgi:hypothetical protein
VCVSVCVCVCEREREREREQERESLWLERESFMYNMFCSKETALV